MTRHKCLISLGSNYRPKEQLEQARRHLLPHLLYVRMSQEVYTDPINFPYSSALFLNQVLYGECDLPLNELQKHCKALEEHLGRTDAGRREHPERMPMDIDIVIWDNEILKPNDFYRGYLLEGIASLGFDASRLEGEGLPLDL